MTSLPLSAAARGRPAVKLSPISHQHGMYISDLNAGLLQAQASRKTLPLFRVHACIKNPARLKLHH